LEALTEGSLTMDSAGLVMDCIVATMGGLFVADRLLDCDKLNIRNKQNQQQ
jgi:hypothetical protein